MLNSVVQKADRHLLLVKIPDSLQKEERWRKRGDTVAKL